MRFSILFIAVSSILLITCHGLPEPIACTSTVDCSAAPCLVEPCVTPDAVDCISNKCRVLYTDPSCPTVIPYSVCTTSMIDPILVAISPNIVFYEACRVQDICGALLTPTGTDGFVCNSTSLQCDPVVCPTQDCFVSEYDTVAGECTLTSIALPVKPAETDDTCFEAYCDDTQGVPGGLVVTSFFDCNEFLDDPCGLYRCNDVAPFCTLIGTRVGTYPAADGTPISCATGDTTSVPIDVSPLFVRSSLKTYTVELEVGETRTAVEETESTALGTSSVSLGISGFDLFDISPTGQYVVTTQFDLNVNGIVSNPVPEGDSSPEDDCADTEWTCVYVAANGEKTQSTESASYSDGTTSTIVSIFGFLGLKRSIENIDPTALYTFTYILRPGFFPQPGLYTVSISIAVIETPVPTPVPTPSAPSPTCTLSRCHWLENHGNCDKNATDSNLPTTFCGLNETEILEGKIVNDAWVFLAQEYFVGRNNYICTNYTAANPTLQRIFEEVLAESADQLSSVCSVISPGNGYASYGKFISLARRLRSYIRRGLCADELDTYKYCTPTHRQIRLCSEDGTDVAAAETPDRVISPSYRNATIDCHLEPYLEDGTGYYEFMASLYVDDIDLTSTGNSTVPVNHQVASTSLNPVVTAVIIVGSILTTVAISAIAITFSIRNVEMRDSARSTMRI